MNTSRIQAIELTTFASTALTADYQVINPDGLPNSCTHLIITNGSTTAITVSFDGITDNEYVLPTSTKPVAGQPFSIPLASNGQFPKFMRVWVKGTAGTGTIALSGYFT